MANFAVVAGGARGDGGPSQRQPLDNYPTPSQITRSLLRRHRFTGPVREPACGEGYLTKELNKAGYTTVSSDIFDYGAGYGVGDFLENTDRSGCRSLITNPPFKHTEAFLRHAMDLEYDEIALLLRVQFLEGIGRHALFKEYPPLKIWVFSHRVNVSHLGLIKPRGGLICFAWWVWHLGYSGPTGVDWINDLAVDNWNNGAD